MGQSGGCLGPEGADERGLVACTTLLVQGRTCVLLEQRYKLNRYLFTTHVEASPRRYAHPVVGQEGTQSVWVAAYVNLRGVNEPHLPH